MCAIHPAHPILDFTFFIEEYDTYNSLVLWGWWLDCNGIDIAEMHH